MRFLTAHDKFSFAKSGLRIIGCFMFPWKIWLGALFFFVAEVLGILEEL